MSRVGCTVDTLPNCCGVKEIGGLCEDRDVDYWMVNAGGETAAEAWKQVLDDINSGENKGYVMQIWFVKKADFLGKFHPEYDHNELRELVQQIPNIVKLGEHRNPNTGNLIDGYMWVNT